MLTTKSLKSQAKLLRAHLSTQGIELTHSQALEAVAASHAFKNWRTAEAVARQDHPPSPHVSPELYMQLERKASSRRALNAVPISISKDDDLEAIASLITAAARLDPEAIELRLDPDLNRSQLKQVVHYGTQAQESGAVVYIQAPNELSQANQVQIPSGKTRRALDQAKRIRLNKEITDALENESLSLDDLVGMLRQMATGKASPEDMELVIKLLGRMGRLREVASSA